MSLAQRIKKRITPFQIIIAGFAVVILLGTYILMSPAASASGEITSFEDALFTVTSAVCVTGLVVQDTATYWSDFGQLVIMLLIQVGGLGVMTIVTFAAINSGKAIGVIQRETMQNAISAPEAGGLDKFIPFVFLGTFTVEALGAVVLGFTFVPQFGARGIWLSIFHSVSAFCNAGFDLMGTYSGQFTNLTAYADNVNVSVTISLLIIIGGIGFVTWDDIATHKWRIKRYRMQSKVILVTTALIIILPSLYFFFNDFAGDPMKTRVLKSFFQAVTPRTAGFNTADYEQMSDGGRVITIILMLIGGSPGSTAGGMKTTTFALIFANVIAVFLQRKNANFFGRRIDDTLVKNAATIFTLYITLAVAGALIISSIEGLPVETTLFETSSAVATVGLSLGATPSLGFASHMILVFLMFFGRVGVLTIVYAIFTRKDTISGKYPSENIMIG